MEMKFAEKIQQFLRRWVFNYYYRKRENKTRLVKLGRKSYTTCELCWDFRFRQTFLFCPLNY